MKRLIILIGLLCCFGPAVKAQDPSFSQYYASPLSFNPANTGFFDGDVRIGINERQQWWNVGYNYNATSLFIDAKLFKDRLPEDDVFAMGFSGVFENSLNGALHNNSLSLSGTYHKSLDYRGAQTLGLGVQVNYTDKYLDYSQLSFASQFNGKIFDLSVPVVIGNPGSKSQYFDLNAGLLYAAHLSWANLYAGASLYHISQPNETLYNTAGSQVPMRKVVHAGGAIPLNEVSSIMFSGYYTQQADATDGLYGGAYGLKLNQNMDEITLYLGMWRRVHSSLIPYLGADYRNISFGINYGLSSSSDYGFSPQTIEVSVIYKLKSNSSQSHICPRF
jgi:type IX secretion system PorP/SprF family membrane protein